MRRFLYAAAALAVGSATVTAASAQDLSGDALKGFIAGKTINLKTPYGLELPLIYRSNGQVSGDVSGFTMARMFAPRETGKWWVKDNRLCQQWPTWYDGKALCFTVKQTGERTISWVRDDGLSGTARIAG